VVEVEVDVGAITDTVKSIKSWTDKGSKERDVVQHLARSISNRRPHATAEERKSTLLPERLICGVERLDV